MIRNEYKGCHSWVVRVGGYSVELKWVEPIVDPTTLQHTNLRVEERKTRWKAS
jgi:hypothetical protein